MTMTTSTSKLAGRTHKGDFSAWGRAKFYEGPLPPDFKDHNPDTVAGTLPSSTTKPDFGMAMALAIRLLLPGIVLVPQRFQASPRWQATPSSKGPNRALRGEAFQ